MKNKGLWIMLSIIAILTITIITQYNSLVSADLNVDIKWAEVENQFKRRTDLIPDLVKVANKYASHETEIIEAVTTSREKLAGATTTEDKINAENELENNLSRLLVIMENYPELKSDQTYIRLMDEMAGTENRIAVARQEYNNSVGVLNTKLRVIPTVWFANMFGFESKPYYNIPEENTEKPDYDI